MPTGHARLVRARDVQFYNEDQLVMFAVWFAMFVAHVKGVVTHRRRDGAIPRALSLKHVMYTIVYVSGKKMALAIRNRKRCRRYHAGSLKPCVTGARAAGRPSCHAGESDASHFCSFQTGTVALSVHQNNSRGSWRQAVRRRLARHVHYGNRKSHQGTKVS